MRVSGLWAPAIWANSSIKLRFYFYYSGLMYMEKASTKPHGHLYESCVSSVMAMQVMTETQVVTGWEAVHHSFIYLACTYSGGSVTARYRIFNLPTYVPWMEQIQYLKCCVLFGIMDDGKVHKPIILSAIRCSCCFRTDERQTLTVLHRINGFSDFIHRPDSKELGDTNTFWKLDLFPSSGKGRHLFCWDPIS
jgi:hypothetical protein